MTARSPQGPRSGSARSGASPTDGARREAIRDLLAPTVAALGLELEDVELRSAGRRLILRVLVDTATGISLDEVATAAQAVSEVLDGTDALGDAPYTLEVSSPGVDRPLTLPRHWQRNVGRLVAVSLTDGGQVTGRLTRIEDDDVVLEVTSKGRSTTRVIPLTDVRRAVVEVEFSRSGDAEGDELEAATHGPIDAPDDDVLDEDVDRDDEVGV